MVKVIQWVKVPGYENYSISEMGDIRNDISGRLLKPSLRSDKRCQIELWNEEGSKIFYVNRLVYEVFKENPSGMYIRHKDGNPLNNSINNLVASNSCTGGKGKARMKRERRVIDLTTNDIYESERECVLAIEGTPQGLWSCLNGYTKTYKGHTFQYAD